MFRFLVGSIALLLALAVLLWLFTARQTDYGTAPPPTLRIPSDSGLIDEGAEHVQTFARPLFWQDREPAAADVVAEEGNGSKLGVSASDLDGVVFLGVIVEANRQQVFLADGDEVHILRNGEIIRGFTVTTIGPESVLLVKDGVQVELPKPVDRSEFIDIRPAN